MIPRRPLRLLGALGLTAVLLAGCRLDLAAVADLETDGSGTLALTIRLDDALLTELDGLAIDPTLEVTALARELDGWELERTVDEQAAITVTLSRTFDDPAEVGDAFRALAGGLAPEDPALLVDVDLAVDDQGGARLAGEVGFRPPATGGAQIDGEVLGPDAAELAALTADVVRPQLTVTLPGPVEDHDADRLEGRTVSWAVPIGETRTVAATSMPPGIHEQPWVWATVVGVLLVLGVTWLALRRRR